MKGTLPKQLAGYTNTQGCYKYKVGSHLSSEGNDPPSPPGTAELLMGQAAGDELPRRDGAL